MNHKEKQGFSNVPLGRSEQLRKEIESHEYSEHDITCDDDCESCVQACNCSDCLENIAELRGREDMKKEIREWIIKSQIFNRRSTIDRELFIMIEFDEVFGK